MLFSEATESAAFDHVSIVTYDQNSENLFKASYLLTHQGRP